MVDMNAFSAVSDLSTLSENGLTRRSLVGTLLVLVASLVIWSLLLSKKKKEEEARKLKFHRSWSFTSNGMRIGCFPPATQAPETIINAANYFDSLPSVDQLVKEVIEPLLKYDRFRTILTATPDLQHINQLPFEPSELVRQVSSPATTETEFQQHIFELCLDESALKPFECKLPLWEIVRIQSPKLKGKPKGSGVCILRTHHTLCDGLSLVAAFDKILTSTDGSPVESKVTKGMLGKNRDSSGTKKPKLPRPSIASLVGAVGHVLTLGATKFDTPTAFIKDRSLTYNKRREMIVFPSISLSLLKDLKGAASTKWGNGMIASINDVLMFAVSQAIHDYSKNVRNDPLFEDDKKEIQCRALLPASLPRKAKELGDYSQALANRWCMVSADLSVGNMASPLDRLRAIHDTTTVMKRSPRAFVQLWVQNNIAPLLPTSMARQTTLDIFSRHSLVLTNVPGPEQECLFASQPVKQVQMIFPNVISQISLLSYAGTVDGNFVYDPVALPECRETFPGLYAKALVDLAAVLEISSKVPTELVEAANKTVEYMATK